MKFRTICLLIAVLLLCACAQTKPPPAPIVERDSSINWPDGEYSELTNDMEKHAYIQALQEQLSVDEYIYLPDGDATAIVESRNAKYLSTAGNLFELYPELTVLPVIG